jgi:putative nucleotidyltransferase with HDIG domain
VEAPRLARMKLPQMLRAALQVAATAAAFKLLSDLAAHYAEAHGVSYLFPPAAVVLAAGAAFGARGVAGVFLGSMASRWGAAASFEGALLFSLVHAATAAIPAMALRHLRGDTTARLGRVILWGVVVNNLFSAVAGTAVLVALGFLPRALHPVANNFLLWWTSDLMAALVLGLPLLLALDSRLLLAEPDRRLLRNFLGSRHVLPCAGLIALALALSWVLAHSGWGFPHWVAVTLLAPVALAALRGGAGAALLTQFVGSLLYFGTLLTLGGRPGFQPTLEFVAPLYVILVFFSSFALVGGVLAGRNRLLLERVQRQQRLLERDFDRIVTALAAAIEAKDPTTEGHVQRVAELCVEVGNQLGLPPRELLLLRYGAMLHDVGKIGVPESVLNKPGPLTTDERAVIESHIPIGVKILAGIDLLQDVVPLVELHQERWDGLREGVAYPGYHGLCGDQIPLGARILAAVDAFDAITHDRPYREGRPVAEAIAELEREAGRQFDPRVVRALVELLEARQPPAVPALLWALPSLGEGTEEAAEV